MLVLLTHKTRRRATDHGFHVWNLWACLVCLTVIPNYGCDSGEGHLKSGVFPNGGNVEINEIEGFGTSVKIEECSLNDPILQKLNNHPDVVSMKLVGCEFDSNFSWLAKFKSL